jgi:hypothetical protein
MNQWMRNTSMLAAMTFAAAILPWCPVLAVSWLVIAFWLGASDWEANTDARSRHVFRANDVAIGVESVRSVKS